MTDLGLMRTTPRKVLNYNLMKQKNLLLLVLAWTLLLAGCKNDEQAALRLPEAPDYARPEAWFNGGSDGQKAYDVFYIVPTCVFDWTTPQGDTCHYMNTADPAHRKSVDGPLHLARNIFADEANFFAPYYRQITIESWTEPENVVEERFETAFADIQAAFRYYLAHFNHGRPFVLAGHSQGGKAVIELLKQCMNDSLYRRMIAAYPLGYPVKDGDLSPYLRPAANAAGVGVCVTFNTVDAPSKLPPLLSGSRFAINPLNWRTDTVTAPKENHLGTVFTAPDGQIASERAGYISARLDESTKALVITGPDPTEFFTPSLAGLFPPGNYHVVELNFFSRNLQQNVKERAAAFFALQSSVRPH